MPGHGASLGTGGPSQHRSGQGTVAAIAECQGQVVDRLLEVHDVTQWLLRTILDITTKLGFKDILSRKRRCNIGMVQIVAI